MALPGTVRVKLSSEAAESISISPVVVQDLPLRDLIEHMLPVAGKDETRIRELLLRGTLVSGASRFRWAGWEVDTESLRELLATFPDSDPAQRFAAARCIRAVLRGARQAVEIPREAAARKGWLRRASFWDLLMETAAAADLQYAGYSYRDRADRFTAVLATPAAVVLAAGSARLRFSTLRDQVRMGAITAMDLYVTREIGILTERR